MQLFRFLCLTAHRLHSESEKLFKSTTLLLFMSFPKDRHTLRTILNVPIRKCLAQSICIFAESYTILRVFIYVGAVIVMI